MDDMKPTDCPKCSARLVCMGASFVCLAFLDWQGRMERTAAPPCDYHEIRRSFEVPVRNLARLTTKIAKLARKAGKLGQSAPVLTVGKSFDKPFEREGRKVFVECVHVEVSGEAPRINGWTFAATVDHDGEENVIRSVATDESMPRHYRSANPNCEHCHTARRRSETFLLKSDSGEWKQVGRSCLKDFLGHADPAGTAACAEYLAEAMEEAGECSEFGGSVGDTEILYFLSFVACAVRLTGWVSRKGAEVSGGQSTCNAAYGLMYDKTGKAPKPIEADQETAEQAIEWARAIADDASEFDLNLRAASKRVAVSQKNSGITAYLVAGYLKLKTQRAVAAVSEYVGTVGQRFGGAGKGKQAALVLTVEHVTPIDGRFGTTYLHIMSDAAGNKFKWFASGVCLETGEQYDVTGTVKAHEEYKGSKQTVLSRCAAAKVGTVAPPKPGAGVVAGQWRLGSEQAHCPFAHVLTTKRGDCTVAFVRADGASEYEATYSKEYVEHFYPTVLDAEPTAVTEYIVQKALDDAA